MNDAAASRARGRPRSEASRQRILSAALELLEERGLGAMTMCAIAERAETSKVTLYRWWSHKAAIVLEAMLTQASPEMPYRKSPSPLESLRDQMRSFVRFLAGPNGRALRGLIGESVADPEVANAYREHWVFPRREDARKLLARAVAAGEIRPDVDLEVALDALFGPLYHRLLLEHGPLDRAFADAVFEAATEGIAVEGARG